MGRKRVEYEDLRAWVEEQTEPDRVMEDLGLFLVPPTEPGGYHCSPRNAQVFASTGGDGVHFSFVDDASRDSRSAVVVMTVPMSREPNWIVGGDLLEFLDLGSRCGYFSLESFAYGADPDVVTSTDQPDGSALGQLVDRFSLSPWVGVAKRLTELDRQFGDALIIG